MFNTTHIHPTRHIPTTVVEKRAPTDESVRLYGEFEKAALDRIISGHSMDNNAVSARWLVMRDHITDEVNLRCQGMINGHQFNFTKTLCRFELYKPQDMLRVVHEEVCRKVAETITMGLVNTVERNPALIKP